MRTSDITMVHVTEAYFVKNYHVIAISITYQFYAYILKYNLVH